MIGNYVNGGYRTAQSFSRVCTVAH